MTTNPPQRQVLVIEDEHDIADLVALHLSELPSSVSVAHDGLQGLRMALEIAWDAVVLDIRLPGMNGFDVCRELRAQASPVPLLMLTARDTEHERVLGLELGADDYLVKPFSMLELRSRVKALMRRSRPHEAGTGDAGGLRPRRLRAGRLTADHARRRVWLGTDELTLTPREFDLLWHFMEHAGQVFTRSELLADVWGYGHDGYEHTVNTHINRLRAKLGDDSVESRFIHTMWGVGYRFEAGT